MTTNQNGRAAAVPVDTQSDPEGTVGDTLRFIVELAEKLVAAKRVWLFGSRASGRARRHSDIDVAVEIESSERDNWSRLAVTVSEDAPTLLDIDLVDIERCAGDLRAEILKTGTLIYERA